MDQATLDHVIHGMVRINEPNYSQARSFVNVVDAFSCPRWDYDLAKKAFAPHPGPRSVLGTSKADQYRRHYELVKQHLLRGPAFTSATGTD